MSAAASSDDSLAAIRAQAADWIVRLHETGTADAAAVAEHRDWCAVDARHAHVYEQMARLWQGLETHRPRRRRRGLDVALGALLLVGWWQSGWLEQQRAHWGADARTGVGEIRRVALADGSQVVLNTDSAIDIEYSAGHRVIRLRAGEIQAVVARDPARPFTVIDRDGAVTALGTRYSVRLLEEHSEVAVQSSRVEVAPNGGAGLVLGAGERARFDVGGAARLDAADNASWVDGRLLFNDAPLAAVLAELKRYRPGLLRLGDGELAELRFTGALPAADSDAALDVLAQALPLRVRRATPYLVWLEAAE